jgi:hypothetical protein
MRLARPLRQPAHVLEALSGVIWNDPAFGSRPHVVERTISANDLARPSFEPAAY